MFNPACSILISSYNRSSLFKRTLFSIAGWANLGIMVEYPTELVVCDDGSTEDTLSLVQEISSLIPYTYVRFDRSIFEEKTGLKKLHNNPCVTNNIAFKYSQGQYIFQQGNEVIAYYDTYRKMLKQIPEDPYYFIFSTTYDIPPQYLNLLDSNGANLSPALVKSCEKWPLQSHSYRSDVTNYISLAPRKLWERLSGYDERYYSGIAAEDSDFVRRGRAAGAKTIISNAVSLHQYHSGKTTYYDPPPSIITKEKWDEGVKVNRLVYDNWDGKPEKNEGWDWGKIGVKEVISNWK